MVGVLCFLHHSINPFEEDPVGSRPRTVVDDFEDQLHDLGVGKDFMGNGGQLVQPGHFNLGRGIAEACNGSFQGFYGGFDIGFIGECGQVLEDQFWGGCIQLGLLRLGHRGLLEPLAGRILYFKRHAFPLRRSEQLFHQLDLLPIVLRVLHVDPGHDLPCFDFVLLQSIGDRLEECGFQRVRLRFQGVALLHVLQSAVPVGEVEDAWGVVVHVYPVG